MNEISSITKVSKQLLNFPRFQNISICFVIGFNKHLLLTLTLLLFIRFSSFSQFQFKVFDTESGLSNNAITKILQDKRGYLWIGTLNGLNRFDGYSFKVFKHDPHNANSLAGNIVTSLAIDKSDRLWMGHTMSVVTCYDPAKNEFTRYKLLEDSLSSPGVNSITIGKNNFIWVGIAGQGVIMLNPKTRSVQKIDLSPHINKGYNPKDFINFNIVNDVYEDEGDIVWLATADGLYQYNRKTASLKPLRLVSDQPGKLRDDYLRKIMKDPDGGFWLSSALGGICHYSPASKSFETYKYTLKSLSFSNNVSDLAWKSTDTFWVGSADKGLGLFDIPTKIFSFFKYSDVFSEESDSPWPINVLLLDRANVLWAGTNDGLVMVKPKEKSFVFKSTVKTPTFAPYDIRDIVDDARTRKKFFATGFGPGLMVSNQDESNWHFFNCRINTFYENFNIVQDLLNEEGDSLWVVSRDNIRLFDKVKERWIDNRQLQKMEARITPSFIKMIKDKSGDYWIASYRNGGYHLKKEGFNFINFKYDPRGNNSICSNHINDVLQDNLGRIWFASIDKGISIYDPDNGKFILLSKSKKADFVLPTNAIYGLTKDNNENIWIASDMRGVIKATIVNKDSLRTETFDNDLLSSPAVEIMADAKGRIWYSGPSGVNVLYPETMLIKTFGKRDGLSNSSNHFIKNKDVALIGGTVGYYSINEAHLEPDTSSLPLVINSVKIFGREIFPTGIGRNQIDLPYDQNSLAIDFTAINFSDNKNIKYSYKLEGSAGNDWSSPSSNRSTEYVQLNGGNYTFKIKASNPDGIWSEESNLLYIHIGTPFWRTVWFYAASSALVIGLLILFYNFQIARIRNHEKEKSEVNKRISRLQLKALYAQMNPHFIFNCLNAINGYIVSSETMKASEFLTKFSRLMRRILENSTEPWITLEKELETLRLYLSMEELRFEQKFESEITVEEGLSEISILIPSMIIQPYVENAIWHGLLHKEQGIGKVSIKFLKGIGNLKCIIEDNGIGREGSQMIKHRSKTFRKSFGLKIISERLQLLQDSSTSQIHDLKNEFGEPAGTRITVTLTTKKVESSAVYFNG